MKEHKKRSPAEPVAAAGGGGEAEGEGVLGPTPDAPAAATGAASAALVAWHRASTLPTERGASSRVAHRSATARRLKR